MKTLRKIKEEKNLWAKILARAKNGDEEAIKVVRAMRSTLTHFHQENEDCADSLLKMQALRRLDDTEWDSNDPLVSTLVRMLEHFQEYLREDTCRIGGDLV